MKSLRQTVKCTSAALVHGFDDQRDVANYVAGSPQVKQALSRIKKAAPRHRTRRKRGSLIVLGGQQITQPCADIVNLFLADRVRHHVLMPLDWMAKLL